MNRIHIVGRKNHGKTRLVVELIPYLNRRGLRVATIKHTHHQHELDTPGKDSWQHRQAGAAMVGVLSQGLSAIFLPVQGLPDSAERYDSLAPLFSGCDLLLVEGNSAAIAPKVEVWREELGTEPLYPTDSGVEVVVTDSPLTLAPPQFTLRRHDMEALTEWILFRLKLN